MLAKTFRGGTITTGAHRSYDKTFPLDPTIGLSLGHCGGPKGECCFLRARYPCRSCRNEVMSTKSVYPSSCHRVMLDPREVVGPYRGASFIRKVYRLSVVGDPLIPRNRSPPPASRTPCCDDSINKRPSISFSCSLSPTGHSARCNELRFCGAFPSRRATRYKRGMNPFTT